MESLIKHYPITALCSVFQLANMILPEDENFLLIFRREAPLDNSVDFIKVRSQTMPNIIMGCNY